MLRLIIVYTGVGVGVLGLQLGPCLIGVWWRRIRCLNVRWVGGIRVIWLNLVDRVMSWRLYHSVSIVLGMKWLLRMVWSWDMGIRCLLHWWVKGSMNSSSRKTSVRPRCMAYGWAHRWALVSWRTVDFVGIYRLVVTLLPGSSASLASLLVIVLTLIIELEKTVYLQVQESTCLDFPIPTISAGNLGTAFGCLCPGGTHDSVEVDLRGRLRFIEVEQRRVYIYDERLRTTGR